MKIRHAKPLPRCFSRQWKTIIAEGDIAVRPSAKLHAKLLIFETTKDLRTFWKSIGHDIGAKTLGAVNALSHEIHSFSKDGEKSWMECDPRYFCIIGLVKKHLRMEIICHESIHAGFAYAKRRRGDFWTHAREMDEESVCYPAGRIASAINRFLHDRGLYDR